MKAAATSNAIGTGRNAPATATRTMPKKLTCVGIACDGINSATIAPSNAARIMRGMVVAARRARFLRYCLTVPAAGTSQPTDWTWHWSSTGLVSPTSQGTDTSNRIGTATRTNATSGGNSANTMVSTTTFSIGELIMVASTVVELAPPSYRLWPIGATQLAHTPRGTPVIRSEEHTSELQSLTNLVCR